MMGSLADWEDPSSVTGLKAPSSLPKIRLTTTRHRPTGLMKTTRRSSADKCQIFSVLLPGLLFLCVASYLLPTGINKRGLMDLEAMTATEIMLTGPPANTPALEDVIVTPSEEECMKPLNAFNVDCLVLKGERVDPYRLARQDTTEYDLASKPCGDADMPTKDGSRAVLKNIHLQALPDSAADARVLCMIFTQSNNHDTNLKALKSTWGKRCHGFVALSNETALEKSAVALPVYGGDRENNAWQKMRTAWKYVWHRYSREFDWFLLADDDTYVIWENLVDYLSSGPVTAAAASGDGVYLGRRFKLNNKEVYTSGGAGYVLDTTALRKLVANLDHAKCDPEGEHKWVDVFTGRCLQASGVQPMDTRDFQERERFNPFQPWNHYQYNGGDWFEQYSMDPVKKGIECCSTRSVTFHLLPAAEMLQTHRYLYKCRTETTDF